LSDAALGPVAVDGAELFLGRAIVKALIRRGVPVRALVADEAGAAHEGADHFIVPLGDGDALAGALEGARAVVASRKLREEFPREGLTFGAAHADRTRELVAAAETAQVERFVYVGVAGLDRWPRGRLRQAEEAAEKLLAASKIPTLALRASLVAGPGDGRLSALVRRARSMWPALVFVGQGWARSAPLTATDFGACVAAAVLADEFPAGHMSIGGPELLTAMEIQDRLLERAGRRKLKVHVPESFARLGAWVAESVFRRPPVTRARLAWLLEDMIPDRAASTKLLGRRPAKFEAAFDQGL